MRAQMYVGLQARTQSGRGAKQLGEDFNSRTGGIDDRAELHDASVVLLVGIEIGNGNGKLLPYFDLIYEFRG